MVNEEMGVGRLEIMAALQGHDEPAMGIRAMPEEAFNSFIKNHTCSINLLT